MRILITGSTGIPTDKALSFSTIVPGCFLDGREKKQKRHKQALHSLTSLSGRSGAKDRASRQSKAFRPRQVRQWEDQKMSEVIVTNQMEDKTVLQPPDACRADVDEKRKRCPNRQKRACVYGGALRRGDQSGVGRRAHLCQPVAFEQTAPQTRRAELQQNPQRHPD